MKASTAMMEAASPPFMSQAPRPIDLAVAHDAGERIDGPALAGVDDVDMRIEMDRLARPLAFAPRDDIGARIPVGVAGRAFAADIDDVEAPAPEASADILGARHVGLARRVDRRKADEVGGECDEFVAAPVDGAEEAFVHGADLISPDRYLASGFRRP